MGTVLSKVGIGNSEWDAMPWRSFMSPRELHSKMPTFVAIEYTYHFGNLICLYHALKTNNLPLYFSSFICGTANDIFFMFLPFCDNFWQGQATVMITPRLPLYIVELYAVMIYIGTTAARQLNLSPGPEAMAAGLFCWLFYHVYDCNGPPHLWWTWHDADLAIAKRHYNAPIGSSMWILTYMALHSITSRFSDPNESTLPLVLASLKEYIGAFSVDGSFSKQVNMIKPILVSMVEKLMSFQLFLKASGTGTWIDNAKRILFSASTCTPLFMMSMGIFQIGSLDKIGVPGSRTVGLTLITFIAVASLGVKEALDNGKFKMTPNANKGANFMLYTFLAFFYAANLAIARYGKPENHVSTGTHQTFSDKSKVVVDIMGYDREDFIMKEGPVQYSANDYRLPTKEDQGKHIIHPQSTGVNSEWYTIFGIKKTPEQHTRDQQRIMKFAALALALYGTSLL